MRLEATFYKFILFKSASSVINWIQVMWWNGIKRSDLALRIRSCEKRIENKLIKAEDLRLSLFRLSRCQSSTMCI